MAIRSLSAHGAYANRHLARFARANRVPCRLLECIAAGLCATAGGLFFPISHCAADEARPSVPDTRQIEEIVVTAERKESTVSDTSISITAFTGQMLADFGIRSQEDLQRFIPATAIQPYDIAIRGVGRPYRALGGDPGVATYLNGVYSEEFGIASSENQLYDVESIEVLRGPQGTLYGRNARSTSSTRRQPTNSKVPQTSSSETTTCALNTACSRVH